MLAKENLTMIDENLLLDIFKISSPSNKEDKMKAFIKAYLTINTIDFDTDKMGNIFNLNIKDAPVLSSHMDTVEDVIKDSHLMKYVRIYEDPEYGKYLRGYGVIGGDDKCGIFIILSLLKKYHNKLNFIFSVNEEHGMTGIKAVVDDQKFDNVTYGIVLDRRGAGDIICVDKNYGTKLFEDELKRVGTNFGYKPAAGASSDAGYIAEKVSCANLSVGYYNPHTKKEFVILEDMKNAMDYTENIISELNSKFAPPAKKTYDYTSGYSSARTCKICYASEYSYKAVLKWSVPFKAYICVECIGKMNETMKDPDFIKVIENKVITIPITHEGD